MNKRLMNILVGIAVAIGLTIVPSAPAQAAVAWDGSIVQITSNLPSDWPVAAAVNWLDQYTGSDLQLVSKCKPGVRRCITIKNARITGKAGNPTGWSEGKTITIDVWKTKNVEPFKGDFDYATKRYLLVHELAHQRFLSGHSKVCTDVMYPGFRCKGKVPALKLTAAQQKVLRQY